MVKYYANWLEQKGRILEVEPLEFIGMVLNHKYPRLFHYNNKEYYGEKYKVKYEGEVFEAIFRIKKEDYISPTKEDFGWNYTLISKAIKDDKPNYHIDSLDYFLDGSVNIYAPYVGKKYENFHLILREKKQKELNKKLRKLIRETKNDIFLKGLTVRLHFQTNPCYKNMKKFKKFRKEFPEYNTIINNWLL